mmetsp:Transcript_15630/g.25381  ORF Transcript_15630/g.25381 Transcript_15630/m.25381 type:complete len:207 (+) Transcript_15630:41-661(+)
MPSDSSMDHSASDLCTRVLQKKTCLHTNEKNPLRPSGDIDEFRNHVTGTSAKTCNTFSLVTKQRRAQNASLLDDYLCRHWVLHISELYGILRTWILDFFIFWFGLLQWLLYKILLCGALLHWNLYIAIRCRVDNLFSNQLTLHWLDVHLKLGLSSVDRILKILLALYIKANNRGYHINRGYFFHTACIFSQGLGRLLGFLLAYCRK